MSARKRGRTRARSSGRGRKPGQTSPAIAKAARKSGKLGGRPRDRLPDEVIAQLGDPPATAKELRVWCAGALTKILVLSMKGAIAGELAASLRANIGAILRALPADTPPAPRDDDEDEDDELPGAELEEFTADGGLRVE